MGWLVSYEKLRRGETVDSRMRENMSWSQSDAKTGNRHEIIATATVGSTWYAAVRMTPTDKPPFVFALICLTSKGTGRNGDGFGYKDMDETMGPNEASCPVRILNLLTPTDSEFANEWRKRCRERRADQAKVRAATVKFAPGVTIRLPEPLSFGGVRLDTFTIIPTPPRHRGIIATSPGRQGFYRLRGPVVAASTILSA